MDSGNACYTSFEELCPGIVVYRNVLSPDIKIIETIEKYLLENKYGDKWSQALVGYGEEIIDYRDCFNFKLNPQFLCDRKVDNISQELLEMHFTLFEKQNCAVKHYCSIFGIGELEFWEATNFVKYGKGQHFSRHTDHGFSYNCTVSLVGYPNDDYDGGEIEFETWGLKLKPQIGDLIIFPSNYMYPHKALPVSAGTKYSLVTMLDYNNKNHKV
jgi:hypothetical protein